MPGGPVDDIGVEEQLVDLAGSGGIELAEHHRWVASTSASSGPASGRTARTSASASVGRYSGRCPAVAGGI
ncbi:MAG: hypothetical protein ACRDRZ_04080 [Pseudonocardiaceae bacterium]